jgi:hypothetical protein
MEWLLASQGGLCSAEICVFWMKSNHLWLCLALISHIIIINTVFFQQCYHNLLQYHCDFIEVSKIRNERICGDWTYSREMYEYIYCYKNVLYEECNIHTSVVSVTWFAKWMEVQSLHIYTSLLNLRQESVSVENIITECGEYNLLR